MDPVAFDHFLSHPREQCSVSTGNHNKKDTRHSSNEIGKARWIPWQDHKIFVGEGYAICNPERFQLCCEQSWGWCWCCVQSWGTTSSPISTTSTATHHLSLLFRAAKSLMVNSPFWEECHGHWTRCLLGFLSAELPVVTQLVLVVTQLLLENRKKREGCHGTIFYLQNCQTLQLPLSLC